jgi:hypothetical protein
MAEIRKPAAARPGKMMKPRRFMPSERIELERGMFGIVERRHDRRGVDIRHHGRHLFDEIVSASNDSVRESISIAPKEATVSISRPLPRRART